MKKILVLSAVIAGVTLLGFLGGKKACERMCQGTGKSNPYCHFSLDINPNQARSLGQLESGFRAEADRICMDICKERWEVLTLIGDKQVTQDQIFKRIEEIGAKQILLEKKVAQHILDAQKLLTPQQSDAYLARLKQELADSIKAGGYRQVLEQKTRKGRE